MTQADANPVGFLQEFVQKYNLAPFPKYTELGAMGPDHCRVFTYKCFYDGYEVEGSSRQKKQAKSEAAKNMIELLKEKLYFEKHGFSFASGSIKAIGGVNHSPQGGVTENVDIVNLPSTKTNPPSTKNPISALQEYCQENKLQMPEYFDTSSSSGFICKCTLKDRNTYGNGITKKSAKTESAAKMCYELQISFSGEQFVEKETVGEEIEFESNKNPISALQELCQRNSSKFPTPVYQDKAPLNNLFVVICSVGNIMKKGMSTTKKAAKIEAAQKVLSELITNGQTNDYNRSTFPKQSDVVKDGSGAADSSRSLKELILGDHEDDFSSSGNQLPALDLSKTMESLNLDDSVVEVEPTRRITINSNVVLLSDPPRDISTKTKNDKASENILQE